MTGAGDQPAYLRLDEEKLETLRRWGEGLVTVDSEELTAAGRAILLLVEEVERLHVDLWHARRETPLPAAGTAPDPPQDPQSIHTALRDRLRLGRRPRNPFPTSFSHPVEEGGPQDADPH